MEDIYLVVEGTEFGGYALSGCGYFKTFDAAYQKAFKANLEFLNEMKEEDPEELERLIFRYEMKEKSLEEVADLFSRLGYPPAWCFAVKPFSLDESEERKM